MLDKDPPLIDSLIVPGSHSPPSRRAPRALVQWWLFKLCAVLILGAAGGCANRADGACCDRWPPGGGMSHGAITASQIATCPET
jgi:hypothetical protein